MILHSVEQIILKDVLEKTVQFFRAKTIDSPRLDAELLISHALKCQRIDLYLKYEKPLSQEELNLCRSFVRRRSQGEPVAYILGEKAFFRRTFFVNQNVLIPRPETELLVEVVLDSVLTKSPGLVQILDIGCGSGCIGISLAKELQEERINFELVMLDISELALVVAKNNAKKFGVYEQSKFILSDANLQDFEKESFNVIVANPPYVSVLDNRVQKEVVDFEPHKALFAENEGLAHILSWSTKMVSALKPGGVMGFEFGIDQAARTKEHFEQINMFSQLSIIKDLSGIERHIIGVKKGI